LGQPQRGQRRLLGWLEDVAVTRGQGRAELPRGHQQRGVPRDDLADDAERLGILENEVAKLPDEPASFRGCHAAPRAALECLAGGADGAVDVFGVSLGYVGEGFPGSRVRGLERLA